MGPNGGRPLTAAVTGPTFVAGRSATSPSYPAASPREIVDSSSVAGTSAPEGRAAWIVDGVRMTLRVQPP